MNTFRRITLIILCAQCAAMSAGPINDKPQAAPAGSVGLHSSQITETVEALRRGLIETRRDLHMHPELPNREERTARVVADRLRALGFDEVRTNVARHGVVGLLKGARPGPVVALRADMDALPINETLDVPYRSLNPGVKHACGHDVHTSVALGVAEVLSRNREQLPGSVKFIFQPAEEGAPAGEEGGAAFMVKEGALERPRPEAIFAVHVSPELEAGQIGYLAGPAQASSDGFSITVRGKMAHAADPHKGIDPIVISAECISALQTMKSRRFDPFEPLILTIGTIHGGNRQNVIPDTVAMTGTVRAFSESVRDQVESLMRQTLEGVAAAHGAKVDFAYSRGTFVVYNHPKLVTVVLPSITRVVGETNVVEVPKRMGAEDFCFYQKEIPGVLLRLGVGNKAKGITAEAHTPEFDVDEECLSVGVKVLSGVLWDYLDANFSPPSDGKRL